MVPGAYGSGRLINDDEMRKKKIITGGNRGMTE
jgi:hypothetical protein